METYSIILLFVAIILNAAGDAKNNSNNKSLGHLLNSFSILALLLHPLFVSFNWLNILIYTFLRIGFFDITYNISRGLRWDYMGNSNYWDKFWKKCPSGTMLFIRIIVLTTAISIHIRYIS